MNPGSTDALNGLLGAVLAGSVIYLLIWLFVVFIASYIFYRIVRTAVRDGMVDAHNKTGGLGSGGGTTHIQGYPPVQVGAPPAPSYTGTTGTNA